MKKRNNCIFIFSLLLILPILLCAQDYTNQSQILSNGGGLVNGAEYENFIIIGEPILSSGLSGDIYDGAIGFFPEPDGFVNTENEEIPQFINKVWQNYPNPFNPETTIEFGIKENSNVLIEIYNIKGQKVKTLINGFREAGYHSVIWNGKDNSGKPVASGLYFYRMRTDNYSKIRKMILLK